MVTHQHQRGGNEVACEECLGTDAFNKGDPVGDLSRCGICNRIALCVLKESANGGANACGVTRSDYSTRDSETERGA